MATVILGCSSARPEIAEWVNEITVNTPKRRELAQGKCGPRGHPQQQQRRQQRQWAPGVPAGAIAVQWGEGEGCCHTSIGLSFHWIRARIKRTHWPTVSDASSDNGHHCEGTVPPHCHTVTLIWQYAEEDVPLIFILTRAPHQRRKAASTLKGCLLIVSLSLTHTLHYQTAKLSLVAHIASSWDVLWRRRVPVRQVWSAALDEAKKQIIQSIDIVVSAQHCQGYISGRVGAVSCDQVWPA